MRTLLIVILVSLSLNARAGDLRALLTAKSVAELESQTRATSALTLAHDMCAAELVAKLLPRSCFRELELAKGGEIASQTQRLTRICVQNAKASRSRLDLSGSLVDLPADCRRATSIRLDDLQYIDEASSPETSVMRTLGPNLEMTSRH